MAFKTLQVSIITAKKPAVLSKSFSLSADGTPQKSPGGQLIKGEVKRLTVSLQEFAQLLAEASPNQAFTYGVPEFEFANILPQAKLNGKVTDPPTIARDRAHFSYPDGAGVMMLDYDPAPGQVPLTRDGLLNVLYRVCPELKTAPHIYAASASSCIYRADGTELRGICGQRVYIPVMDATDIPRCGNVLFQRLWLAGSGFYIVSASGALLDRSLIDASVWQPERLDFAGGAKCGPGLKQIRPEPMVFNADAPFIDSRSLPALLSERKTELEKMKQEARAALKNKVLEQREVWIAERLSEALTDVHESKRAGETERLRDLYRRAVESKRLLGDFVLHSQEDGKVTITQVLNDPDKYHGARFADPLEPDYGNDPRIAVVNLRCAGKPYLYSHAHGGQRFSLHRAIENIQINDGELHVTVRKALEMMRKDGAIFDRGDELVRIADGRIYPADANYLAVYLTGLIHFTKHDRKIKASVPKDCPSKLPVSLVSMAGAWDLPKLAGIVTAPLMDQDGRIIDHEGYDPATGIYLNFPQWDAWQSITRQPGKRALKDALDRLWHPFKDFPFIDSTSKGAYLAAILTAIERVTLPTAPGILITSPTAGSGKTLLAHCLAALTGIKPVVMSKARDEAEMKKSLFASARLGDSTFLLDNVSGGFFSDALCAFLTSEQIRDRVLGVSSMVTAPTRTLVVITGNNVQLHGDLNRRFIRAEIDPRCERPASRRFDLDPLEYVKTNRMDMINAALTILAAAQNYEHPEPLSGIASFEEWNTMIRRAVVMVGALELLDVSDPAMSIDENCDNDPDRILLGALLTAWQEAFENGAGTVRKAIELAEANKSGSLYAACEEIAGEAKGVNSRKLGRWIQARKNRIVNGLYFIEDGKPKNAVAWKVKRVSYVSNVSVFPTYARKMQHNFISSTKETNRPNLTNQTRKCVHCKHLIDLACSAGHETPGIQLLNDCASFDMEAQA